MAIKLTTTQETIKVVSAIDSSLNSTEGYAAYLETLDENLLDKAEPWTPTRFVLRKVLPFNLSRKVQDTRFGQRDDQLEVRAGFTMEEVRCALVDIENDPSVPPDDRIEFKRDGDGGADKELIARLQAAGVVEHLWAARNNAISGKGSERLKKK